MLETTINTRRSPRLLQAELARRIEACCVFPAVVDTALDGDAFAWLQQQTNDFKLVWADRGAADATMGLGVAKRITASEGQPTSITINRCRKALEGLADQRFYGGFAFRRDGDWENSPWQSFGSASFWLPRVTLQFGRLRVVVLSQQDVPAAVRAVNRLCETRPANHEAPFPAWIRRVDRPDREHWSVCVAQAAQLFGDEVLEKVVLGRQVDMDFDGRLCPVALLRRLARATPECYHFCFQTSPHVGFVGATPERLFWRKGQQLFSEVLAGTRPRGNDSCDDRRLGQELLASSKDQLEHDIVRKSVRQRLHACVASMHVDAKASLLKLANKQHLVSRVSAQLLEGISDGMLVDRLHPTPAVGGYPTENALDEIRRLEPFERGWYAAPVGWIGLDEVEFAVAIRSGLVHQNRLALYSGAGIVPGSTAEAEWDEIEQKISDFLQLLTPAAGLASASSR
jgi:menaquinone-specific isochorismate synthase